MMNISVHTFLLLFGLVFLCVFGDEMSAGDMSLYMLMRQISI